MSNVSKSNDIPKLPKSKSNSSKKKNPKKVKISKNMSLAAKSKISDTSVKNNLPTVYTVKNKKTPKVTTELSPFFYSVNASKYRSHEESVKPFLKFVKNITIAYPIMIPAREPVKSRESYKSKQKQKEKSRDVNSNRNLKNFPTKTVDLTTIAEPTTAEVKDKATGKFMALAVDLAFSFCMF